MRQIAHAAILAWLASAGAAAAQPQTDEAAPEATAPAAPRIDQPFGNAWLGAADGDATLIVFADYACPACRDAQPILDRLADDDPGLRIVYRILVNEPEGLQAARTSLAVAAMKGADWNRFHHALDAAGAPTPEAIARALAEAGIDPATLPPLDDDSLAGSPITDELVNNESLLLERKGKAIPAFVIGQGKAWNGYDIADLHAAVERQRARKGR